MRTPSNKIETRCKNACLQTFGTAVLLTLGCGLLPVVLSLVPRPGEAVVVLTLWPDASVPRAILATEASVLTASTHGHLVIVPEASSGLVAALYQNGATLVLAAAPLGGCLPRAPLSHTFQTRTDS